MCLKYTCFLAVWITSWVTTEIMKQLMLDRESDWGIKKVQCPFFLTWKKASYLAHIPSENSLADNKQSMKCNVSGYKHVPCTHREKGTQQVSLGSVITLPQQSPPHVVYLLLFCTRWQSVGHNLPLKMPNTHGQPVITFDTPVWGPPPTLTVTWPCSSS